MSITAVDDAAWSSPWRDVRVGTKVAVAAALVLAALIAPTWPGCPLVAGASVLLCCGPARIPPRTLGIAAAAPLLFLLLGAASIAMVAGTPPPDALLALGPLSAGPASLARAADALAHGVAGTLAVMLLATTTPMVDLLAWLRARGVPAPLVDVASLTYRLLFVLLATAVAIRDAQLARLADAPGVGPRRRLEQAAAAIGSVLVRSWERAARLQAGLEARGYEDDLVTLPRDRPRSRGRDLP